MDHCVHSECFMGLPISLWGDLKLTSSGGGGGRGVTHYGAKTTGSLQPGCTSLSQLLKLTPKLEEWGGGGG